MEHAASIVEFIGKFYMPHVSRLKAHICLMTATVCKAEVFLTFLPDVSTVVVTDALVDD